MSKNLDQQSDCIISNPRILKDEAIQVLFRNKIWINEAIESLQTPEAFSDEAIQLILLLLLFEVIAWAPHFMGGGVTDFILPERDNRTQIFQLLASKSGPHIK